MFLPAFADSGAHLTNLAFYDANLRALRIAFEERGLAGVAYGLSLLVHHQPPRHLPPGMDRAAAIRHVRRDAMDQLKKHSHDSGVTEDEIEAAEKDLQKLTDD